MLMIALLAIFPVSCTSKDVKEKLAVSEEIIMSEPDSALTLIKSINTEQLRTSKEKAMYGLLYTMAMDKTHQPLENCTIIDYSVDYFRGKSDKEYLAISLYYQGRTYYFKNNYSHALVSYFQAIDEAEKYDNKFYIGMACRGISDIYSETMNAGDELAYAKREYENFKAAGIQPYINYAKWDLAYAYQSNGEYKKVYELTTELLDSANKTQDTYLYVTSQRLRAKASIGDDNPETATRILESLCRDSISNTEDSIFLAVTYALSHNPTKSAQILETIHIQDSMLYELAHFHVSKAQGNVDEALRHSDILDKITNDTLQNRIAKNVSSYVSDYYQLLNKQNNKELSTSKTYLALISIIAVLTVALIIIIAHQIIRRQEKLTQDNVIYATKLQRMLDESTNENAYAKGILKEILSDKYDLLEELCSTVSTQLDSKQAHKIIAAKVNVLIKEISIDGNKISQLENEVNKTHDNLISDFKNDLPGLKDADYCLFLFSVLKFKNPAIRLLLKEEKVNAIYNRKRRLKDRIKKLEQPKAEKYLNYFNYSTDS